MGDILLADRAYDSDAFRTEMAARGAWANIKPMPNRKRRLAFSAFLYRYRTLVERFFNKLKQFRAIATRYEKAQTVVILFNLPFKADYFNIEHVHTSTSLSNAGHLVTWRLSSLVEFRKVLL